MATVDRYKIVLDVDGQQAVDKLKSSLSGLGSLIAGLGIAAFSASVLKLADDITDLSDATGIAVDKILAFQNAVALSGGKAEEAGKLITTFYQNLAKAADGGEQAQDALAKVGIKLNDLKTLSEQDLLSKALEALKQMPAGAERTAAGMELMGKAFRNLNPEQLKQLFDNADFSKNADDIKRLGELADKMAANFHTMQLAGAKVFNELATAMEPFIGKVEQGRLSLENAEKMIKAVGIAIGVAFGIKTIGFIIELVEIIKKLNTVLKGTAIVQATIASLSGPAGWGALAIGAGVAAASIVALNKALEENKDAQKEAAKGPMPAAAGAPTAPAPAASKPAFANASLYSKQELQARYQAAVAAKLLTDEMRTQNAEALKLRDLTISLIGEESNYANLVKSNAQVQSDGAKQVRDLESKIVAEKAKGRGTNQEVIAQYQAQIALVKAQTTAQLDLNQKEYDRIKLLTDQKNQIEANIALGQTNQESIFLKEKIKLIQLSGDAYKVANGQLQEVINNTGKLNTLADQTTMLFNLSADSQRNINGELTNYLNLLGQAAQQQAKNGVIEQSTNEQVAAARQKIINMADESRRSEVEKLLKLMQYESIRHQQAMQFIKDEADAQRAKQNALEIKQVTATDQASLDIMKQRLELIGLFGDQLERAQSKLQIEEELQNRLLNIEKQRMALGAQATQAELDHLATLEQAARDYANKRTQIEQQRMEKEKALQQNTQAGIDSVIVQMQKMTTPFQQAQQMTTSLFNNMNSAIDNFVKTGKFSFKDFARSVIQDLIAIELKAQATKILSAALGSGGSIFDFFTSMFKAEGGPVDKSKPYVVGEKGPELFIPKAAGKVIPNNQFSAMNRPGRTEPTQIAAPINNTYVTNNISALDAKSVAQLFAENRKTLLGTVQMAQKELPYANR